MAEDAVPSCTAWLAIGERETLVQTEDASGGARSFRLAVGYLHPGLAFRGVLPTELELEAAIAHVEDAVMPLARQVPPALQLRSDDAMCLRLRQLLPSAQAAHELTLDEVEGLFNEMAARAMGRPAAVSSWPADAHLPGYVLILREFMHHLAVDRLALDGAPDQSFPASDASR